MDKWRRMVQGGRDHDRCWCTRLGRLEQMKCAQKWFIFPLISIPSHRPSSLHNKGGRRRRRRRRSRLGEEGKKGGKRKKRNKREEKEVEGGTSPAPGRYPSQQETRVGKVIGGPRAPTPIDSPPSLPPSLPPALHILPCSAYPTRLLIAALPLL